MRTRRNNDRMLLESLVRKYRKNSIVKAINEDFYYYDEPETLYYGKLSNKQIREWAQDEPDLWDFINLYCKNDDGNITIYQITDTYERGLKKMSSDQIDLYMNELDGSKDIKRCLPKNVSSAYITYYNHFGLDYDDGYMMECTLTNIPLNN